MDRFVLVARLKPDGRERAEELLSEHTVLGGEEFERSFDQHVIFLSETDVVFFFEGEGARVSQSCFQRSSAVDAH
jgi:hypothetical protein